MILYVKSKFNIYKVFVMNNVNSSLKVLVVVAHSDDEVLGCGGTLLRHKQKGDNLQILFLTNGVSSRGTNKGVIKRSVASQEVAKILGANSVTQLDFPDNKLDTVPLLDVAKSVEQTASLFNPDIVYTHFAGDLNIDHKICSEAVSIAFRSMPGINFSKIYGFEVQSSTEWSFHMNFTPNHFVNITETLEEKKSLMSIYEDEIRDFPHPRSHEAIDALAKWRGSIAGFKVVRKHL